MWTNSKYDSKCHECDSEIIKGDRMVYDIETRKAYCKPCGEELDGNDPLEKETMEELSSRTRENLRRRRYENSSAISGNGLRSSRRS